MKHVLLVNDDGISAPGIAALIDVFSAEPDLRVSVMAPDRQRSANSQYIHLWEPLRMQETGKDRYAIDGTPADCVKLAHFFFEDPIDVVVSGINSGENMGVDVYYSGTVAAAREAVMNGIQGLAVSLSSKDPDADYGPAARLALKYARLLLAHPLPSGTLLNMNVPLLPREQLRGERFTRLGHRLYAEGIDRRVTPFGQTYFWLNCANMSYKPLDGSDLDAVAEGYVALTPVKLDATDYGALERLVAAASDRDEAVPVG